MKTLRFSIVSIILAATILTFQNCKKDDEIELRQKEVTTNILKSKEWVVSSMNVPQSTATLSADWDNFTLSFSATNITTSGHATGAQAVWPSGTFSMSEDGKSITRHDGVVIHLSSISETNFTAIFSVPPGTSIGARVAALEGEYIFNMR